MYNIGVSIAEKLKILRQTKLLLKSMAMLIKFCLILMKFQQLDEFKNVYFDNNLYEFIKTKTYKFFKNNYNLFVKTD